MRRTLYLVIFAVFVATITIGGYYYSHRNAKPAATPAAVGCDTPAPPPPPKTPPPKVPDFGVEAGCGPSGATKKK